MMSLLPTQPTPFGCDDQHQHQHQQQQQPPPPPISSGLELVQALMSEMQAMSARMVRLESMTTKMQESVGVISVNVPGAVGAVNAPAVRPRLSVVVADPGFETLWYAERPYPEFVVSLVDADGKVADGAGDDWVCQVSVLDGYGQTMPSHLFTCPPNATRKGVARISSLKFHAVSSKNGGHFRVAVRVTDPANPSLPALPTLLSPEITVLSSRLFHNPKALPHQLSPLHPLSALPGVGKCYARRFAALGVRTVGELARIDVDQMSDEQLGELVGRMRKGKGTLTSARLVEYVNQAKVVVAAFSAAHPNDNSPNNANGDVDDDSNNSSNSEQGQGQEQFGFGVHPQQPAFDLDTPKLFNPSHREQWDDDGNEEEEDGEASSGSSASSNTAIKRKASAMFVVPAPKRVKFASQPSVVQGGHTPDEGRRARSVTL